MRYIHLIIIALAAIVAACADKSPSARVADAVAARQMGDNAQCLAVCDGLLADSAAFNELTANENGRGIARACEPWSELAGKWLNREFPWWNGAKIER